MDAESEAVWRVLVVDDEPGNTDLVRRTLQAKMPELVVVTKDSGQSALEDIEANLEKDLRYHLLLVDHRMPGMTGVELLERSRVLLPAAVNIIVTAFPDLPAVIAADQSGLVGHLLAKPWKQADLLSAVQRAVNAAEVREAVVRMQGSVERMKDNMK